LGTQFVLRDYSVDVFHLQPRNQLHEHPIGHDWVAATEQEWIVTDVVGAIDGIARLTPDVKVTVHSSALDANGPRRAANTAFDVVADGVSMRVAVVDHIWSPEMYAPLAARLLSASGSGWRSGRTHGARRSPRRDAARREPPDLGVPSDQHAIRAGARGRGRPDRRLCPS